METDTYTAASSSGEEEKREPEKKVKKTKSKKRRLLTINLTNCKYDSVCRVSRRFGLRPVGDDEDWTIFWTDTAVVLERVMDMKRYQKINHFPGMVEICRKDFLARNMNKMLKLFPKEYNVFPRSWCMPADYGDFQAFCRSRKNKTFISKPESSCQGKGIFVFKNARDIKPGEHCVVQQYIAKPFIIDGFKFDLRIYVLVTSCDPLRVYVYKDGLGRFATVKYHDPSCSNVDEQCMHLTNYAINKTSKDFVRDDDVGSKRRISTVNQWFVDNGYDIDKIWADIEDVIIKTLIAAHPILKHNYRTCFPNHNRGSACFEILGFDALLDKKLKPWLIEVNHSPSFHTDAPLDKEVKEGLLHDTLDLIDIYFNDKRKCIEEDKRKVQERLLRLKSKETSQSNDDDTRAKYAVHLENFEKTHLGGFRRIYPKDDNEEVYAKFFNQSTSLCAETAASRARSELSKMQREDIATKQKELESYRKKLSGAKPVTGAGKSGEVRPESPASEKKVRPKEIPVRRRMPSFRIPMYSSVISEGRPGEGRESRQDNREIETPMAPYGGTVSPLAIRDEEELERLAGMQLRDSLVRGLGVSDQLEASLNCSHLTQSTSFTDPHPQQKPNLFTSRYLLGQEQNIGTSHSVPVNHHTPVDHEQRLLGTIKTTPLHTLPGTVSMVKMNESAPLSHVAKQQQNHWSTSKHSLHGRYQARNSIQSSSAVSYRPSPCAANRYMKQALQSRSKHSRHQQDSTCLGINSEVLGLSVISAPIRLTTRHNPGPGPAPHSSSDHWKVGAMTSDMHLKGGTAHSTMHNMVHANPHSTMHNMVHANPHSSMHMVHANPHSSMHMVHANPALNHK